MQALWNGQVIADAPKDSLIRIEGNWYFPPESLKREFFTDSDHVTTCFWKGEAKYYDITVDGVVNEFGAWYYPEPKDGSVERVKHDFKEFVAFWNGVTFQE